MNFTIQTSQVDVAGYGVQIHFSPFQKSQRFATLGHLESGGAGGVWGAGKRGSGGAGEQFGNAG
jgi:hypothetical protein